MDRSWQATRVLQARDGGSQCSLLTPEAKRGAAGRLASLTVQLSISTLPPSTRTTDFTGSVRPSRWMGGAPDLTVSSGRPSAGGCSAAPGSPEIQISLEGVEASSTIGAVCSCTPLET
eukprot:5036298-Prymnesium_polylepis.1